MKTHPLLLAGTIALLSPAHAAVIIADDFSGSGASGLDGTTPDTNNTAADNDWVADSGFLDNGLIDDTGNMDRSAYIDLGAAFSFSANTTYTLTLDWSGLDNALWFAGFVDTAPTTGSRLQTQGNNFLIRVRSTDLSDPGVFPFTFDGTETTHAGSTTSAAAPGSAVLTLETNSLSDAVFSVDDSPTVSVDLTATDYRYLSVGIEDAGFDADPNDDQLASLTFEEIPEPGSSLLAGLGLATLLIRRRRS